VFKVDADDAATTVVIAPYAGAVADRFPWCAGRYDFAAEIHGTLLLGDLGDFLIGAAASLGIIMVVSGIYLHWPRGERAGSMVVANLAVRGRAFWKSPHGVVGLCIAFPLAGAAILVILVLDWLVLRHIPAARQALS
jgi:uncharacterized iron-regulated membrane protein